jgi:hypothetical protein
MNRDPFDNDFFKNHNKRFEQNSKLVTRGATAFLGIWLVWALVCLAGAAGLVYVLIHFISKFW